VSAGRQALTHWRFHARNNPYCDAVLQRIYWSQPAQREFNVLINGSQVLTNFDIVGLTGAKNKAIQEQFQATANRRGRS